jgi:hypothetical protein
MVSREAKIDGLTAPIELKIKLKQQLKTERASLNVRRN